MRFPVAGERRFQQAVSLVEPPQLAEGMGLVGGARLLVREQRVQAGTPGLDLPGQRGFELGKDGVRDSDRRRCGRVHVGRAGEKHREDKSNQACFRDAHRPILVAAASAPVS